MYSEFYQWIRTNHGEPTLYIIKKLIKTATKITFNECLNQPNINYWKKYNNLWNSITFTNELLSKTRNTLYKTSLNTIILQQSKSIPRLDCSNFVINYTDIIIPPLILEVLARGPKFILPKNNPDSTWLTADLKYINDNFVPPQYQDFCFKTLKKLCQKLRIPKNNKPTFNALHTSTSNFVKENPDLIITKSDKGNKTVIITKQQYEQLIYDLLNNTTNYTPENNINFKKLISRHNAYINFLHKINIIPTYSISKYKATTVSFPVFYGLPKTHKPNLSLRPIVSTINSFGSSISKLLQEILQPFFKHNIFVKNSFEVKDYLDNIVITNQHILISLDMINMYTNIPIEMAIQQICNCKLIFEKTKIPLEFLKRILQFLMTDCSLFSYKGTIYRQLKGIPMGTSLGPLLSQVIMKNIYDTIIKKFDDKILLFLIFYDDTFCIMEKQFVNQLFYEINEYHPDIKFTIEYEQENKLNFLELTAIKREDQIITDWYSKPIASGRSLNFYSQHLPHTINATAKEFIIKVKKLSHPDFLIKNADIIRQRLELNQYPQGYIEKLLRNHYFNFNQNNNNHKEPIIYSSIPINHNFHSFSKTFLQFNTKAKLTGRPISNNYKNFFTKLKDFKEPGMSSDSLFTIPCLHCPKQYLSYTEPNSTVHDTIKKIQFTELLSHHRLHPTNIKIISKTIPSKLPYYMGIIIKKSPQSYFFNKTYTTFGPLINKQHNKPHQQLFNKLKINKQFKNQQ